MYRYGFVDGQEHGKAETARHYHLKRSWARQLEGSSIDIIQSHMITCGEYYGSSNKEMMEAG